MDKSSTKGKAPEVHISGQSNSSLSRPAHALTYQHVAQELSADTVDGLSATEAKARLEKYGPNDLGEAEGVQPLRIIIAQIANAMTMVSDNTTSSRNYVFCRENLIRRSPLNFYWAEMHSRGDADFK